LEPSLFRVAWARIGLHVPTGGKRPSGCVRRGACRRCDRVRRAGRHWRQGVRAQGHTGPPHFLRHQPGSARPEKELNRGATVRGGKGAQAPRALQHEPPIVAPVQPFWGMAVRPAGRRVQQVQATGGQFVDELGVEGSAPRTWARSRRGRRWARVGLHVAAPSQGKGRPREGFRGGVFLAIGNPRGRPAFPSASSPPPDVSGGIPAFQHSIFTSSPSVAPREQDTQARQRVAGSWEPNRDND